MKKNQKKDVLLISALLCLAILCGFYGFRERIREAVSEGAGAGRMEASVSLEGREVLRLRIPDTLEEEAEVLFLDAAYVKETEGTFMVYAKGSSAPAAGYNVIEAADGGVLCSAADCPDLVCVHTGTIHRETEMIACLPHRMSVQLIAAS